MNDAKVDELGTRVFSHWISVILGLFGATAERQALGFPIPIRESKTTTKQN